jgi:hypothetical protein
MLPQIISRNKQNIEHAQNKLHAPKEYKAVFKTQVRYPHEILMMYQLGRKFIFSNNQNKHLHDI